MSETKGPHLPFRITIYQVPGLGDARQIGKFISNALDSRQPDLEIKVGEHIPIEWRGNPPHEYQHIPVDYRPIDVSADLVIGLDQVSLERSMFVYGGHIVISHTKDNPGLDVTTVHYYIYWLLIALIERLINQYLGGQHLKLPSVSASKWSEYIKTGTLFPEARLGRNLLVDKGGPLSPIIAAIDTILFDIGKTYRRPETEFTALFAEWLSQELSNSNWEVGRLADELKRVALHYPQVKVVSEATLQAYLNQERQEVRDDVILGMAHLYKVTPERLKELIRERNHGRVALNPYQDSPIPSSPLDDSKVPAKYTTIKLHIKQDKATGFGPQHILAASVFSFLAGTQQIIVPNLDVKDSHDYTWHFTEKPLGIMPYEIDGKIGYIKAKTGHTPNVPNSLFHISATCLGIVVLVELLASEIGLLISTTGLDQGDRGFRDLNSLLKTGMLKDSTVRTCEELIAQGLIDQNFVEAIIAIYDKAASEFADVFSQGDVPIEEPKFQGGSKVLAGLGESETPEDALGYKLYANALADLITHPDTETPITLGLAGKWGMGKTTLMRYIGERIDSQQKAKKGNDTASNFIFAEFSPWKYSKAEEVWPSLDPPPV